MVGVAGVLLFGDLTGAQAGTTGDRAVGPAAEATTPHAAASSATVTLSPSPAASGAVPSSAALPIITCRITVLTPDSGSLFVYTWGEVHCNYPISEMYIYVELTKNGQVERYNERVRVDTAGFSLSTEAPCSRGVWQAFAWAHLLAPPGYVPPTGTISKTSGAVTLNIDSDCQTVPPPPPPPTTTTTRPPVTLPPCPPDPRQICQP